jgi:hypothetical protein
VVCWGKEGAHSWDRSQEEEEAEKKRDEEKNQPSET